MNSNPHHSHTLSLARVVSIAGHPFVFVLLLLSLPYWLLGERAALRVTALVAVLGVLPLGFFLWQRSASGRWENVDASRPGERPQLYGAIAAIFAPLGIYLAFFDRSRLYGRGCGAMALMLAAAALATRWLKVSLHLAMACFSALALARVRPVAGLALLVGFVPLLGWSRLTLARHTTPELIAGAALGMIAGGVMAWWM